MASRTSKVGQLSRSTFDAIRNTFRKSDAGAYEPLPAEPNARAGRSRNSIATRPVLEADEPAGEEFSWIEYSVFLLLGVAMLWAWNMFLAAAPYFQTRFQDNPQILKSFQSAITSVSTITNLASMLVLSHLQSKANYPKRILLSLVGNVIVFTLLAISTKITSLSSPAYLAFTLIMVFSTSVATGLCQNGAFAFAAGFGRPEYIQAMMTGQAVAGVLPSIAQIVSVLAFSSPKSSDEPTAVKIATDRGNINSAFVYFLTATAVSLIAFAAVFPLIRKHNRIAEAKMADSIDSITSMRAAQSKRKHVSLWTLYKKLHWFAAAVFLCFAITMFFPVFTSKIVSVVKPEDAPRILQPSTFIPLGFLLWNLGDLTGRLSTALPFMPRVRPFVLFLFSVLRGGHIPLYFLCNLGGRGAVVQSDAFYLFIVSFGFGLTNGWLSSSCMMNAGNYVDESEREAAGGFMVLNLVAGLAAGSFLSFSATNVA